MVCDSVCCLCVRVCLADAKKVHVDSMQARNLHEDGHWGGEGLVGPMPFGASPLFGNADEKAAFLAECPYLSTLVMFELGKNCTEAFKPKTKQVREVQLGDGREHSDNVEFKRVELTEDEKVIGQANLNAYLEGLKLPPAKAAAAAR